STYHVQLTRMSLSSSPYLIIIMPSLLSLVFISSFFFNDPPTTEIYTLSLHDALPISETRRRAAKPARHVWRPVFACHDRASQARSEEHTSELQSRGHLVCRLLLEKKKNLFGRYFLDRLRVAVDRDLYSILVKLGYGAA